MSTTIARLQHEIHELFELDRLAQAPGQSNCTHFDPSTNNYCPNELTDDANLRARCATRILAVQSPSSTRQSRCETHSFPLLHTLYRLAVDVLCPSHASATIIMHLMLRWLNLATNSPTLFLLSPEFRTSLPLLHDILPQFAECGIGLDSSERLEQALESLRQHRHLCRIINETLNDMFDPYFIDFTHNITQEVIRRLTQPPNMPLHSRRNPTGNCSPIMISPTRTSRHPSSPATPTNSQAPPIPVRSPRRPTSITSSSLSSTPASSRTASGINTNTNTTINSPITSPPPTRTSPHPLPVSEQEDECSICRDPFCPASPITKTTTCHTCRQPIHLDCLVEWAITQVTSNIAASCPLCRSTWNEEWWVGDDGAFSTRGFLFAARLEREERVASGGGGDYWGMFEPVVEGGMVEDLEGAEDGMQEGDNGEEEGWNWDRVG